MSGVIATLPKYQFSSATGAPLANGTLTVYVAGSTTPTNTWQDSALTIANTNPVTLDSRGECVLWLDSAVTYKFVLKSSTGVIQWTADNIRGAVNGNLAASTGSSLVGFIQSGTGAAARTVQDELRETVKITQFTGADPTGVADSTAAFISAAAIGKPINLCGGSFLISTASVIALTAPMFNGVITFGHTSVINQFTLGGSGNYVRDVKFVGGASVNAVALTVLSTATNFNVSSNTFTTFKNGGIAVQSGALYGIIESNRLYACSAVSSGAQWGAIICNANNTIIKSNVITQGSQTGIAIFGCSQVVIDSNVIVGDNTVNSGGIITDGYCSAITISNNQVSLIQVEGIQVAGNIGAYGQATSDVTISGNVLLACALAGIVLYAADANAVTNVSVTGNNIRKSAITGSAIQVNRTLNVQVTGNAIGGYASGIDAMNSPQVTNVIGNTFTGQGSIAINGFSSGSVIVGNKIKGTLASSTGISASTAFGTNIIINDNVIDNCLVGAAITFSNGTNSIYFRNNHFLTNTTDYTWTNHVLNSTSGNTFALQTLSGSATLAGALTTVGCVAIKATDRVQLRFKDTGTGTYLTVGAASIGRIDAGSQFLIVSTNGSDVSNYEWEIIR